MLIISETNSLSLSSKKSIATGRDKSSRARIYSIPNSRIRGKSKVQEGGSHPFNQRPSEGTGTGSNHSTDQRWSVGHTGRIQADVGVDAPIRDTSKDASNPLPRRGASLKEVQEANSKRLTTNKRVRTCKSGFRCKKKDCSTCYMSKLYRWRDDAQAVAEWHEAQGGMVAVITIAYTSRKAPLADLLYSFKDAAKLLFKSRAWSGFTYAMNIENCWSERVGHFPHAHGLLFLPADTDIAELEHELQAAWRKACKANGLGTSDNRRLTLSPFQEPVPEQRFSPSLSYAIKSAFAAPDTAIHATPTTTMNTATLLYKAGFGDSIAAIKAWREWSDLQAVRQMFWSRGIRKTAQDWHEEQEQQRRATCLAAHTCPDCSGAIKSKDEHTSICTQCGMLHNHDHNHHEEELITMPISDEPHGNHIAPLAPRGLTIVQNAPQASSQPHMQPQAQAPQPQNTILPFQRRTAYKRPLALLLVELAERHLRLDYEQQEELQDMKDSIHEQLMACP